jgi:hypothetical protein
MAMQNNHKGAFETKEATLSAFLIGLGVGDLLSRFSSLIAAPLDIILILLGIYYAFRAYSISRQSKLTQSEQIIDNDSDVINPSISKISSPEPHNQSPIFQILKSNLIPLGLTLGVFIWGIIQIIIWLIHKASFNPIGLSLFIGCYTAIPLMIWYSTLFGSRKQRQTGRSRVYRSTSFTYKADNIKDVFNRCYKVLDIMKADSPTQMEVDFDDNNKQAIIKRPVKRSNMVVTINLIDVKSYNIDVSSDSHRPEVEWDCGKNDRNINTFKKLMLSKKLLGARLWVAN